jgi:hypothetical protein
MRPFPIFVVLLLTACGAADEREGGAEARALNEAAAELDEQAAPPPKLSEN